MQKFLIKKLRSQVKNIGKLLRNQIANIGKLPQKILIFFVRLYQILISPFISYNACRFHPSCSQYMVESLAKKGFVEGLCSGVWRLFRCHPWSEGGNDPVK